jgi:hypothetical protein
LIPGKKEDGFGSGMGGSGSPFFVRTAAASGKNRFVTKNIFRTC